jgi:hypothetical protein
MRNVLCTDVHTAVSVNVDDVDVVSATGDRADAYGSS